MSLFRPVPRAALPAAVLLAALVAGTDAAAQAPRHAALSTSAALVRPSAEGLTPRAAAAALPGGDQPEDSTRLAAAGGITAADLEAHLSVLAGDSLEGRETGTVGQQRAAAYIARQFDAMGLKPAGENGGWFQTFPLRKVGWGEVSLSSGADTFTFLEDYFGWPGTNAPIELDGAGLVFAGYGIDDSLYSDYDGLDVRDKVVLISGGEPEDKDGVFLLTGTATRSTWTTDWRRKPQAATARGAKALLVVSATAERQLEVQSFVNYLRNPEMELVNEGEEEASPFCNVLYTTPAVGGTLFGGEKKWTKTLDKIGKKGSPRSRVLDRTVRLVVEKRREQLLTENVLGMVPGTDRADEYVFVTAHYDHLGRRGEDIYNGADDDGSGTVALLEVAEALARSAAAGRPPRRNVVFMTVSGEEKGLLGSEYYSDHPLYPLETTVTNLNIDMVGRIDEEHAETPEYVYLIGSDFLSTELHELSEAVAGRFSPLELDYTYNSKDDPNRFYYRSDHYNFAKHGIPVIFYMNGSHEDYHQPSDTVDKIAFDVLALRARLVFHTLWEVAHRDRRPLVDKEPDDE